MDKDNGLYSCRLSLRLFMQVIDLINLGLTSSRMIETGLIWIPADIVKAYKAAKIDGTYNVNLQ